MKKFVAILLILAGTGAFAQPTSGDIIMVELDSADTLLSYAAPALTFEEAIINAFNLIDGIDGLASIIAIVIFSVFALIFFTTNSNIRRLCWFLLTYELFK